MAHDASTSIYQQPQGLDTSTDPLQKDPEKKPPEIRADIEHVPVKDDPRQWSPFRKVSLMHFYE